MKFSKKLIGLIAALPVAALVVGSVLPADSFAVVPGLSDSVNAARGNGQASNLTGEGGVFQTVVNVLLFVIGAVAVVMLVIGGIRYTVSGGDSNAVTAAKNTILYAIIGIIVAILAYAAVNFVITSFAA